MRGAVVALVMLSMLPQTAKSEELGKELVFAFVGGCMRALPDLERIEAAANVLGWELLEGDVARMLAPAAADAEWKGWLVDDAPAPPYFFGVSTGTLNGERVAICSVANPHAPVEELMPHLQLSLGLDEPIADETSAGQRFRAWNVDVDGRNAIVSLTDAEPMGQPGLTLSGMMKAVQ